MSTIESIHTHLNIPLGRGGMEKPSPTKGFEDLGGDDGEIQGDAIEEEVVEEFDDWPRNYAVQHPSKLMTIILL